MFYRYYNINKMLSNQKISDILDSFYSPTAPKIPPIIMLRFKISNSHLPDLYITNDSKYSYKTQLMPDIVQDRKYLFEQNSIWKITKWDFNIFTKTIIVHQMSYVETDTEEIVWAFWRPQHQIVKEEVESSPMVLKHKNEKVHFDLSNSTVYSNNTSKNEVKLGNKEQMSEQKEGERLKEEMIESCVLLMASENKISPFVSPLLVTKTIKNTPIFTKSFKKLNEQNYVDMIRDQTRRDGGRK